MTRKTTDNGTWNQAVEHARFVTTERAKLLAKLGITRVGDLLYHIPFRYLDLTHTASLGSVRPGEATVIGTVYEVRSRQTHQGHRRLRITEVTLVDGTGTLIGVWFNQPWVEKTFEAGQKLAFAGEVKLRGGLKQIVQPLVERLEEGESVQSGRVLPVHNTTEGLALGWMRRIVATALDDYGEVDEYLPREIVTRRKLLPYAWSLRAVHFPTTVADAELARRRLAYGELLDLQLLLARRRWRATQGAAGTSHRLDGPLHAALAEAIPFTLTEDQEKAVGEILADMAGAHPMRRLLLGDVGTGKTLVAAYALAVAADSGGQAAMMAPTEVLAQQYAQKLGPLFDEIGVKWALLTGSTPSKDRTTILERLRILPCDSTDSLSASSLRAPTRNLTSGEEPCDSTDAIQVLFGTHALLEDDVEFANATLMIVDEQHRFGVAQRRALSGKGESPDVLVMSATPIPRTVMLVEHGDLATSFLRTRPIEGAGVTTRKVKFDRIGQAWDAVHAAVAAGQQAYIVCALVDESSKVEAQSALRMMEELAAGEFADCRVEVLTGRMKAADKARLMDEFRAGEIDVLVSTTVIEVGVDVHNATVMVVLDAERYGLAQLHQLRGRVGRGAIPGEVWLVSDSWSAEARERFKVLVDIDDGFRLAEMDLKQRGAGELLGHRQSGVARFRAADLARDADLMEAARADAFALIMEDFDLEQAGHEALRARVEALEAEKHDWEAAG